METHTKRLTRDDLLRVFWEAMSILRGTTPPLDALAYVATLLLLKHASDRWDGGTSGARLLGDQSPLQLVSPPETQWSHVQGVFHNVGGMLNQVCAALESHNPALAGVLTSVDFDDEHRLGAQPQRDNILRILVVLFSQLSLHEEDLAAPDIIGDVFDAFLERFEGATGREYGEHMTSPSVVELLVRLLDPQVGMRLCDPTCGTGRLLTSCARYVAQQQRISLQQLSPAMLALHGQEINLRIWALCRINLLLHDLSQARIEKGDVLRDPRLVEGGRLLQYDRVIADPPFGVKLHDPALADHDPYFRFRFGPLPRVTADYAFLQHALTTLTPQGKAGLVMTPGVLFRSGRERVIREHLLENDVLEALVFLPEKLRSNSAVPSVVLLFNMAKPVERRERVLLIHAAHAYEAKRGRRNVLRPEDIDRIVTAYRAFQDTPPWSAIVPLEQIRANDYNLSLSLYLTPPVSAAAIDLPQICDELHHWETVRDRAAQRMDALVHALGGN
jgi:type I restriction enzyme M protein